MPHKLLLADDSVTIQRVIELTFADEDIQVIAVGDGQKAIERIEADPPDIVLADVGMPERDGYEVAAFVKSTSHLAHIPVLLLTGAFEPIDEQRAGAVGCDGVLAKPFEPHMVITRVKELLAGGAVGSVSSSFSPVERSEVGSAEPAVPQGEPVVAPDAPAAPVSREEPVAQAAESALRFSRRTPIAVPGFGSPTPPPHAALDEYFERLEGAFASLQQPPSPPPAAAPAESAAPGDAHASPSAAPSAAASAAPTPAASSKVPASGIAQAFSALFAAERGEPAAEVPAFIAPAALPQATMDDLVERVSRQVLERLSDRVVRDTVADIVSRVSERLVRDEIERVKATLK